MIEKLHCKLETKKFYRSHSII